MGVGVHIPIDLDPAVYDLRSKDLATEGLSCVCRNRCLIKMNHERERENVQVEF